MTTTYEVQGIKVRSGVAPFLVNSEHIVSLCGVVQGSGQSWCFPMQEVLLHLLKGDVFFTSVPGAGPALVHRDGNNNWVTTVPDRTTKNNLLSLPHTCNCG